MALRQEGTRSAPAGSGGMDSRALATGLGWFSVGLGLALTLAPQWMTRVAGVRDGGAARVLARLVGVRELASGLGVFSQPQPAASLWARVAGDVMDLTLLGTTLMVRGARRGRVVAATAAVAGVTALDVIGAREFTRRDAVGRRPAEHAIAIRRAITINRAPEDVYRFWRDFTNHPRFMARIESVRPLDGRRSHWRARGPAGTILEWDSEVVDDRPNERIAWRSLPGARLPHVGNVRFRRAPGGRGTEVVVEMEYTPPGGVFGATLAKLIGQAPEQQLQEDLRRLRQLLEVGEIVLATPRRAGR